MTALCISCEKDDETKASDIFEVKTAGTSIDCKLVLIDFKVNDLNRIEKISGSKLLRYQAYNLDKTKYGEVGKVLSIKVRKSIDSELFSCTTLGNGYQWVTVLESELK